MMIKLKYVDEEAIEHVIRAIVNNGYKAVIERYDKVIERESGGYEWALYSVSILEGHDSEPKGLNE